jgi:hypothetical protein
MRQLKHKESKEIIMSLETILYTPNLRTEK